MRNQIGSYEIGFVILDLMKHKAGLNMARIAISKRIGISQREKL